MRRKPKTGTQFMAEWLEDSIAFGLNGKQFDYYLGRMRDYHLKVLTHEERKLARTNRRIKILAVLLLLSLLDLAWRLFG